MRTRVRDIGRSIKPEDAPRPPVAPPRPSRLRSAARAMLGIPLVVLAAMASLIALGETPRAVTGQHITVRTQGTGFSSALVYGAGMGVRLVRVTHEGTPLSADLGTGPMHIISLRALHLDASGLSDQRVRLTATGHTLRLQQDARGVGVRTGL